MTFENLRDDAFGLRSTGHLRWPPSFDIDTLQELAGDEVFARGEQYYEDGQVQILTIERGRVLAQVAGSEDYRTEFRGRGERLAGASEKTHPVEALRVYEARVEHLATSGGNSSYKEAAKLVSHMARLRSAREQTTYVAVLKQRYGRKRNFMKLFG